MTLLLLLRHRGGVVSEGPPPALYQIGFTIGGLAANASVRVGDVELDWQLNSRPVLRCSTIDTADFFATATSYRPTVDQTVAVVRNDAVPLFGGVIADTQEMAAESPNVGVVIGISAVGNDAVGDSKYFSGTFGSDPIQIILAAAGNPGTINTLIPHGWTTGDEVFVEDVQGGTAIDGPHAIVVTGPTSFTIGVNMPTPGFNGTVRKQTRLKTILNALSGLLGENGITLDPLIPEGPLIDKIELDGTVNAALDALTAATGWPHRYTPSGVLEMFAVGTKLATFTLDGNTIVGELRLQQSRVGFANRIIVKYGGDRILDRTEVFVGNGTQRVFPMRYRPFIALGSTDPDTSNPNWMGTGMTEAAWRAQYLNIGLTLPITIWHDGATQLISVYGDGNTYGWSYRESDNALVRSDDYAPVTGPITAVTGVQFPLTVVVQDDASVFGPLKSRARIIVRLEITDEATALAAGASELRSAMKAPARKLSCTTFAGFAMPATVVTVNVPSRKVPSTSCMITGVKVTELDGGTLRYDYSLVEGDESQPGWIEFFKDLKGGSTSVSRTVTAGGGLPTSPTGGGGGGAGGGVSGTGTAGKLSKWLASTILTDSSLSEDVAGNVVAAVTLQSPELRTPTLRGVTSTTYCFQLLNDVFQTVARIANNSDTVDFRGAVTVNSTLRVNNMISTPASTSLILSPLGDIYTDPATKFVLPVTNYDVNIGMLTRKYLTIHAAELWVETLVAQETMATIGGRILVGPTTTLVQDVAPENTSMRVKYNNLQNGDIVYLETGATTGSGPRIEFMRITSAAVPVTGPDGFAYTMIRNLDGTGANAWVAGDAIFNTGQAGNGFIDLYSVRGVRAGTEIGPTIVGNVRNSISYNDWSPRWAIGNLRGLYGYVGDNYGAAFGVNSGAWIKIDPTNGIRIGYDTTTKISLDAAGNAAFAGSVTAASGNIAGFNIINQYLYAGLTNATRIVLSSDGNRAIWIGHLDPDLAPFHVYADGSLRATSATITGNITATSGNVIGALAAGSITSALIAAGAITAGKIAAGSITSTELAAGSVTAGKIAAGSITATEIATGTITASQISGGTITASQIATGTITAAQIATGSITASKLSVTTLDAISVNLGAVTAGSITVSAGGNTLWLNDSGDGSLAIGGTSKGSAPFHVDSTGAAVIRGAVMNGGTSFNGNPFVEIVSFNLPVHFNFLSGGGTRYVKVDNSGIVFAAP